jgi:tight adherence protein B
MNLELVLLATFAAAACGVAGIGLVWRDLVRRGNDEERPSLRLESEAPAEGPGLAGRIDRSLDRLAAETGVPLERVEVLLVILLSALAAAGVTFILSDHLLMALAAGAGGAAVALAALRFARARRLRQIYAELPGVLDALLRGVGAGDSLERALVSAGRATDGPLAKALRRCEGQLALGLSLPAVLHGLRRKVNVPELGMLAAAVNVHRKTGGNIATVLSGMATVVRHRQIHRQQFLAATAGARFSTLLVAVCIPAYLCFALFYQRDYGEQFFRQPMGIGLFALACVLLVIGLVWSFRTLRVES